MRKFTTFSPSTLDRALNALQSGKRTDQYDLPYDVKVSIESTRYTDHDIAEAYSQVIRTRRVEAL